MKKEEDSDIEWYPCPICNKKDVKINKQLKIKGVYIKCKKCGNIIEIINAPVPVPVPIVL